MSNSAMTVDGETGVQSITFNAPITGGTITDTGTVSLQSNGVSYPYLQQASAQRLLGNAGLSTANVAEISLGSGVSFSGGQLVATGTGGTVTQVNTSGPLSGGPITGSGTVTMASNALSYGYIQLESAHTLLGNPTGGMASPSEITLGTNLSFSGTVLNAASNPGTVTSVGTSGPLSGGPITSSGTVTVANNAITYGYIQQSSASRLLGNATGSTANVAEISLGSGLVFSGSTIQVDPQLYKFASGTIATGDVTTLHSFPVLLAPGVSNAMLIVDTALFTVAARAGLVQYTGGGSVFIQYTGVSANTHVIASTSTGPTFFTSLSDGGSFLLTQGLSTAGGTITFWTPNALGQSIYLTCGAADFATGNFDLNYRIWYRVVPNIS